jgi:Phage tail lysozyme/LysM domain
MTHGRHARPGLAQKAVSQTGPLVAVGAVAGVLTTGAWSTAPTAPATPTTHTQAHLTDVVVKTAPKVPTFTPYTVKLGDTLSGISDRYCGSWGDWPVVYDENKKVVGGNPNLIEVGEKFRIDCNKKISALAASYIKKIADPPPAPITQDIAAPAVAPSTDGLGGMISQLDGQGYDGSAMATTALFLFQHGYSRIGAAGVVACIAGESGGNPESVGDGGGGLIGWTPLSVPVTGNVTSDLNAQLEALLHYNDEFGSVSMLNDQPNPVAAADYYSQHFERPAVTDSDVRSAVAYIVYAGL